jgi:hypothetical protein
MHEEASRSNLTEPHSPDDAIVPGNVEHQVGSLIDAGDEFYCAIASIKMVSKVKLIERR